MAFYTSGYRKIIEVNTSGVKNFGEIGDRIYSEASKLSDIDLAHSNIVFVHSDGIVSNNVFMYKDNVALRYTRNVGEADGTLIYNGCFKKSGSTWHRIEVKASGTTMIETTNASIGTFSKAYICLR